MWEWVSTRFLILLVLLKTGWGFCPGFFVWLVFNHHPNLKPDCRKTGNRTLNGGAKPATASLKQRVYLAAKPRSNQTLNSRTLNSRTLNSRALNSRTLNNRTLNNRTLNNQTLNNRTLPNGKTPHWGALPKKGFY
jgi:hypothetical protein